MDIYHLLNEIDLKASFCYQTYIIECNKTTKKEIDKAKDFFSSSDETKFSNLDYQFAKEAVSLVTHEYTHFIDFTSTIFGLEHISRLSQASKTQRIYCDNESQFYPAKKYYDYLKTIRPNEYYNQIFDFNPPQEEWGAMPTSGVYFNSSGAPSTKPIFFFRFLTQERKPIARSPISLISILESSAMAQETLARLNLIHQTDEVQFNIVEFNKDSISYLYDSRLTEYSVCAHLIANRLICKDIITTYRISSILTRIVLNSTPDIFNHIHRNFHHTPYYNLCEGYPDEKLIKKRMRDALRFRDHGALFYLLVSCMPRRVPKNPFDFHVLIAETLAAAQLPNDWEKSVFDYADSLLNSIKTRNIKTLTELANSGHDNLGKLDYTGAAIDFRTLNTPPCYIENYNLIIHPFDHSDNRLNNFNLDESYEEGTNTELWVNKFSQSCLDLS